MKWTALQDAAAGVAVLAGLQPEQPALEIRRFPALIRDAGGERLKLAEQGIDDLAAIMEPGIEALLAIHERGSDAAAPAMALWHEFQDARTALLGLLPHH
ncbi:MAG: hypothetical protein EOP02_12100 [Proteobacteria bacterium]|nr:MAG: hypothetical protein EOP02_12100 [Pseudomonadota bacterium]